MARISVKKLSEMTGLAEKTIRNQVYDGSLPYIQYGRGTKILFDEGEPAIDELLNGGKKRRSVKSRELQSSKGNENILIGGAKKSLSKEVPAMAKKKNSQTWNYGQFRIQNKKGRFYVRYTDYDPEKGKNREFCVAATKATNLQEAENFARGLTNDGWFIDLLNRRGLLEIPGVLEALKEKKLIKGNGSNGKENKKPSVKIEELIEKKISEDIELNYEKSAKNRSTTLRYLIAPYFRDMAPEEITKRDIQSFKDYMREKRPGLKFSGYNSYLSQLRNFLNWCERRGHEIEPGLFKNVMWPVPPQQKKKPDPLTDPNDVIRYWEELPYYGRDILELRVLSGDLREATLKRIKLEYWNKSEKQLELPAEIMKNKTRRIIPVHPALENLLTKLENKAKAYGSEYFLHRNGRPIKDFHYVNKKAMIRAGIYKKGRGFSIMRSTMATLIKKRYGEQAASNALGHIDPKMLKFYVPENDLEEEKKVLIGVGNVFSGIIPGSKELPVVN